MQTNTSYLGAVGREGQVSRGERRVAQVLKEEEQLSIESEGGEGGMRGMSEE